MTATALRRVLLAGALALSLGAVTAGTARAATPACTDSWTNASGGAWDRDSNWSAGHPPSSDDTACISKAGSYAVVVGSEVVTVANLVIGAQGSTPTLSIGINDGSGVDFTVSGAVSNTGTIDANPGNYSFGAVTNVGDFNILSSNYTSYLSFGAFTNMGTLTADGPAYVSLGDGATFDNAGGTINANAALTVFNGTDGASTVQLDSGGMVTISDSGSFNIVDTARVKGGSICGGSLEIGQDHGQGGELAFASKPGTGPACADGQTSDHVLMTDSDVTLSGTIPSGYVVTATDTSDGDGDLRLFGDVVNQGSLIADSGATIDGYGARLINERQVTTRPGAGVTALNTAIVNSGNVFILGEAYAFLGSDKWVNKPSGSIFVRAGQSFELDSPGTQTPTLVQDGMIQNLGTFSVAAFVRIKGGAICGNQLEVGRDDSQDAGGIMFDTGIEAVPCASGGPASQLALDYYATVVGDIPAGYALTTEGAKVSWPGVGVVNAGFLELTDGSSLTLDNGPLMNKGTLSTSGDYGSRILGSVANSGSITLDENLKIKGSLSSSNTLTLGAGTVLKLSNDYTQSSTATLDDQVTSTGYGSVVANGHVALAGAASLTGSPSPPSGAQSRVITAGTRGGKFSAVSGPFTLAYDATGVTATAN